MEVEIELNAIWTCSNNSTTRGASEEMQVREDSAGA
jgi:hypothetical protein